MHSTHLHSRAAHASGDPTGLVSTTSPASSSSSSSSSSSYSSAIAPAPPSAYYQLQQWPRSDLNFSPGKHIRKPMATYGVDFAPVAILVHVLGVVLVAFVLSWIYAWRGGANLFSSTSGPIFNAHPPLMVAGFIFFYSEAILVYKTLKGAKQSKKLVHLSLQAIAFVFALIGVYAAWESHVVDGVDNFYSLHSWLGILTLVLFFIQWLAGFFAFWTQSIGASGRSSLLPWHVFGGLAIYALAIGTATTGLLEKMTFLNVSAGVGHYASETIFVNVTGILLVLFGIVTVFAALFPTKEDDGYQAIS